MTHEKMQFSLCASVWHGPQFGHRLELKRWWPGREPLLTELGNWRGLGIPDAVLRQSAALVDGAWTEHLVTRYGVQGEFRLEDYRGRDPF